MPEFRILILKLGALGDVVRTSYLLPGLHERFGPDVAITWVTAPAALQLLRFNPYVGDLLAIDHFPHSGAEMATFDWIISLDDEPESCGLATPSRGTRVSGAFMHEGTVSYTEDSRPWFDMGLISRFGKAHADELKRINQRTHDQILSDMLGVPVEGPTFFNNPRSAQWAERRMGEFRGRRIGLNLSAGRRWPSKALRPTEAIRLIRELQQQRDVSPVLLGGADDADYLQKVAGATGIPVITNLTLDRFAAVIGELDLLVSSDTLALHFGIAQRVKTLSYYAPTSAAEINPFGLGSKIASTAPDYCCYRPDADNSSITADRLLPEVAALLNRPADRPPQ